MLYFDVNHGDLEHFAFGPICMGIWQGRQTQSLDFFDLLEKPIVKKFNLIYPKNSSKCHTDVPSDYEKISEGIHKLLSKNQDKQFIFIDYENFDPKRFKRYENFHVWSRKFHVMPDILDALPIEPLFNNTRKKWISCLMARANIFRTELFNWIIDNNIDRDNNVSYLCVDDSTERIIDSESCRQRYNETFIKENNHNNYSLKIPFNNFEHAPPEKNSLRYKATPPQCFDSLVSVIPETFNALSRPTFTEKTFKALIAGQYPVVLGGPGSMAKLAGMGFRIPNYVEWSVWDDLCFMDQRVGKLKIIKQQLLDLIKKQNLNEISNDFYDDALYNYKRLHEIKILDVEEQKKICVWIQRIIKDKLNKL